MNNMSQQPYRALQTKALPVAAWFLAALAVVLAAPLAAVGVTGTTVRDITHLQGERENELMAVSLVVGLKGTGDGKIAETMRSQVQMLHRFGLSGANLSGINADNVALVHLTATIPAHGARDGDRLDVRVAAINGAKSLAGGRLIQCPLLGPQARPRPGRDGLDYALASGEVVLEDPTNPTTGLIKLGATMETDFRPQYVRDGNITLVLDGDHATFAIATTIAKIVNEAEGHFGRTLARANGPAEIVVTVPTAELARPADFIARLQDLPVLMPSLASRIVINRRTGTIAITGNVRIDPVVFSQRGLTITTVRPNPKPTVRNPEVKTDRFALLAAEPDKPGATARELIDAFNQLQVPVEDQIAVIWTLKRTGRLHAEVIEQ